MDVGQTICGQIERGETGMSLGRIVRLSTLFNLSLDYLVYGIDNNKAITASSNVTPKDYDIILRLIDTFPEKKLPIIKDLLISISYLMKE